MTARVKQFSFSMTDKVDGQPLTPQNVDLPTLRGYLSDIETLIKGEAPGASANGTQVRIEEGSLLIKALVPAILATGLAEDMVRLEATGDLDAIQPKRAQVIESWMSRAKRSEHRTYSIAGAGLKRKLSITKSSPLAHAGDQGWVNVEKYLTGKVVDLGGKQDPNVHLVLDKSENTIMIAATEKQLAAERENQLYRKVNVRVRAEQNTRSKELRNMKLLEFLPRASEPDEEALRALWSKGRKAWGGVPSASEWVDNFRGNG